MPQEKCNLVKKDAPVKEIRKVALLNEMLLGADDKVIAKIDALVSKLQENGVVVEKIDGNVISKARNAWNILMCAELCNNVSRYDGVKYGYRSNNFTSIDELYTNSRTEAFGDLLKTAILFGSDTLSTENYMKVYDKALRVRRVICQEFSKIFESFDAVIMPACSTMEYSAKDVENNKEMVFTENFYTAPASITGLPAIVVDGAQIMGNYFSEMSVLSLCEKICKEGK